MIKFLLWGMEMISGMASLLKRLVSFATMQEIVTLTPENLQTREANTLSLVH